MGNAPSDVKVRFGMPEPERRDLLDVLLRINAIAMRAFDVIEADAISEADVLDMTRLPDACNQFTQALTRHAHRKIGAARP